MTSGAPIKRPHKTHGATRQRPYQDPYRALGPSDLDQLETASIVSGWSMGEDVRNILYDGESSIVSTFEHLSD
ncbi:hypothetical protein DPMN_157280 [Dreissena polymorpha]|uniref:Uncharacterized protein n=1 Tax=Dreissena polymorpha TaxID=45954 RepID=A0A9D4EK59_DREPO|nr:hypothetical protein DPMN_157280 [Dreissena polymorpha]